MISVEYKKIDHVGDNASSQNTIIDHEGYIDRTESTVSSVNFNSNLKFNDRHR